MDITLEGGRIKSAKGTLEEIKPVEGLEDKAVEAIVFKYKQVVDATLNQVIGAADVDLDAENIRRRETNLGNLIADIIRDVSNADAALINSGAIRTSIRKGDIRAKDIYSVVPFDNYIVAIKVKGRRIREALEHGYSAVEKGVGGFPQVSGISLKYDLSMPPGSRITEIRVKGRPLDPEEEYTVATIDFIASGGDGYKAFGDAITSSRDYAVVGGAMKGEKVVYSDPGTWLRDMVIGWIQSRKSVSPQVEGRMTPGRKMMIVFVNDKEVHLLPGMTVKHALTQAGLMKSVKAGKRVYDEWGNEIGLDGATLRKHEDFRSLGPAKAILPQHPLWARVEAGVRLSGRVRRFDRNLRHPTRERPSLS